MPLFSFIKKDDVPDDRQLIILIEDDQFLANMYVTKLTAEDFKVELATTGEKGLEMIKKNIPNLILLDILLPGMDGFEVLREIKEDRSLASIPVILLTNLGDRKNVEIGLSLGAKDYLIKSHFLPAEVVRKVRKMISNQ